MGLSVTQILAMIGAVVTVALVAKYHAQLRAYFGTKNGGAPPPGAQKGEGFVDQGEGIGIGLVVGAVVLVGGVLAAFAWDESKKKKGLAVLEAFSRHPLEGTGRGSRRRSGTSRSFRPGSRSRSASRRSGARAPAAASRRPRLSPIPENSSRSPTPKGSRAPPSSPVGSPRD